MLQYAITGGNARLPPGKDDLFSSPDIPALVTRCTQLAQDGVAFLLIREKHLAAAQLIALTRRIVHAAYPTRVLVPSRADIALAVGAHGVHLSSLPGELTPQQIRIVLPGAVVSVSCHTLDDIRRARDQQASLALFAPVFGKSINGLEVTPAAGLDALHAACQAAQDLPVFALGGITPANAPHCIAAGAAGVAGIRTFFNPTPSDASA